GNAGKVFAKPKPRTRGWDRVIHDLISETAKAITIYAGRAAGKSIPAIRGSGDLFCSLAEQSVFSLPSGGNVVANNSSEPPNVSADRKDDDNEGGISVIEFVVKQGDG